MHKNIEIKRFIEEKPIHMSTSHKLTDIELLNLLTYNDKI